MITNDKHKLTALEICLKCADIGHGAKKLSIHKIWTAQITKEFFR
jgi:3',5'-cyclic-nucleotide phosphodiesterase/cAMP-specific phosphodiesterase 4